MSGISITPDSSSTPGCPLKPHTCFKVTFSFVELDFNKNWQWQWEQRYQIVIQLQKTSKTLIGVHFRAAAAVVMLLT